MKAGETTLEWLRAYYEAIDHLRLEDVERFLHEQCEIHYSLGRGEAGRQKILERTARALGSLERTEHRLIGAWEEGDVLIFELEVTYVRKDKREIVRPGVGIFVREHGLIREQRLYVNDTAVWE